MPLRPRRLHVAQFCELLRAGGEGGMEAALAYGRQHLTGEGCCLALLVCMACCWQRGQLQGVQVFC